MRVSVNRPASGRVPGTTDARGFRAEGIVDGIGVPARTADVEITGGTITEVGRVRSPRPQWLTH